MAHSLDEPLPNAEGRVGDKAGARDAEDGGGADNGPGIADVAFPRWRLWLLSILLLFMLAAGRAVHGAELRLGSPRLFNQGSEIRLTVDRADTNTAYEVQTASSLGATSRWTSAQVGFTGQSNFVLRLASAHPPAFFRLRIPVLNAPQQLVLPEDTLTSLESVRLQRALPAAAELVLTVTNGILMIDPSPAPEVMAEGNGTERLVLHGPAASLRDISYQPALNFFGHDTLRARLTNSAAGPSANESAFVDIVVTPVNDTPQANPDHYTCPQDGVLMVAAPGLLANDRDAEGEPITAHLLSGPAQGELTLYADGSFFYFPDPLQPAGAVRFTYQARDQHGAAGAPASVTIDLLPVNRAPTVRLSSPVRGSSIAQGKVIPLRTDVVDPNARVARVEYFDNGSRIAVASAGPPSFEATWNNATLGQHWLIAYAIDAAGLATLSAPVTITIDPDCDHDGISDPEELIRGTDPCDFFDGAAPRLQITSGNFQSGLPNSLLPQPLTVRVTNLDGQPHTNYPVRFTVAEGDPSLSAQDNGPGSVDVTVPTDAAGLASVWIRLPTEPARIGVIQASIGSGGERAEIRGVVTALGPQEAWVYRDSVVALAAGGEHALALLTDGTVRAWGRNEAGQLGEGIDPAVVPFSAVPIPVPGLSNVVAIAAGSWHSLALRADGSVAAWGEYHEHQKPTPPANLQNIVAIAAGAGHSLAVAGDGTVRAWGDSFTRFTPPAGLTGVMAVAAGRGFSVALRADGTVVAWGLGAAETDSGQTRVPAGLRNAMAIAAGDAHALALRADGTVAAWGANQFGQASPPADLGGVLAIAAGEGCSLALLGDGSVRGWGAVPNGSIQMLDATGLSTGGSGGQAFGLIRRSNGTVGSWGGNVFGQLGDGTTVARPGLVNVAGLPPDRMFTNSVPFSLHTPLR